MCVWTSFSLFLVTNNHLELPNRSNLHLNIGSWSPEFPSRVPEVPRNPQKQFLLQFEPILELVSVSICVRRLLFSSVFRTTVAARAAKVIRRAR